MISSFLHGFESLPHEKGAKYLFYFPLKQPGRKLIGLYYFQFHCCRFFTGSKFTVLAAPLTTPYESAFCTGHHSPAVSL